MHVYICKDQAYTEPLHFVLKLIEKNQDVRFILLDSGENADLIFDHSSLDSQPLALHFYNALLENNPDFSHKKYFTDSQLIHTERGDIDYTATIFYMVNCLQEFNPTPDELDSFGRFRFDRSYQYRYNSIESNLVQDLINVLLSSWGIKNRKNVKSTFFLSHDIDTIYGSLMQDGFWALKKGRIDIILRIIINEFIRKPHWRNIDKIIKIHSDYDIKTTFFWLVNKGRGELNIKNADYRIEEETDLLNQIRNHGFINGLHKSCFSNPINEEILKHPDHPKYNRYHFLKFLPHSDWPKINDSRLSFDSSLGFAEHIGFRNSFGMPFQPYNFKEKKPFDFVEAPLNIMDGTFHKYMKVPAFEVAERVINFYETNKYNCMFSVCWHNIYFTNYKYHGFIDQYKKILSYIYENKIECLTPDQVINKTKLL